MNSVVQGMKLYKFKKILVSDRNESDTGLRTSAPAF